MICRRSLGEKPCHAPSSALKGTFGLLALTMIDIRIGASTSSAADPTTRPSPSSLVKYWVAWKASIGLMWEAMRARWVSRSTSRVWRKTHSSQSPLAWRKTPTNGRSRKTGSAYKAAWACERTGKETFEEYVAKRWREEDFAQKVSDGYDADVWNRYEDGVQGLQMVEMDVLEREGRGKEVGRA